MAGRITSEIGQQAPLPSTATELVLNIRRTADVVYAWLERTLAPTDLRVEEFNVLRILRGAGEAGHPRQEVERRMVATAERLTIALHRLKGRGLVEGVFDLRIAPAGRELLLRADAAVDGAIRALGAEIPEARMRTAIDVLEQVRTRIAG